MKDKVGTIMVEGPNLPAHPARFPVAGQTFALAGAAQDFCEALLTKIAELGGPDAEVHDGEVFVDGRHYWFEEKR